MIEKAEEGYLRIKKEPGAELDKVVVSAVVPCKDPAVLQYAIVEDGLDCITLGSNDSDVEEINKIEVQDVLENLADLKRQDCIDKLAKAVPEMEDRDVVIVSEKMRGMDLPKCVYEMYQRIGSPGNFRAALAAGERLLSLYRKNQVGADVETIPNLCRYFKIGKTKLHEILCCQKYGKDEPDVKKPPRHIMPVAVKEEEKTVEPPVKKGRGGKKSTKMKSKKKRTPKKKTPVTTTKTSTT